MAQTETLQLDIHGMTCNGCVKNVTGVLQKVPGVTSVEVSLEQKRARIVYSPAQAGPGQLKAAVEDAGFDVV
ncbi:MAG: heavy-metal-associated domain-containing protein [Nitrosomonadales bacterium]|nr:heavy-metal-associated domain-containing protein [candidate division KSB1 bacterium]MBI5660093.1 heavy-metal-associated domain-containing protein [Nitrosomonadales bacterium]